MKLVFFVIACALILIRLYFSWAYHGPHDGSKGNLMITAPGLNERIEWLGDILLNDSETGVSGISPGGYIKYAKNDTQVIVESNVKGVLTYRFPGNEGLSLPGRDLIMRQATHELISHGFDADNRMERLFRKGGYPALIREMPRLQMDQLQQLYLNRIIRSDSLATPDIILLTDELRRLMPDETQQKWLGHISASLLDTPAVRAAFFQAIDNMRNSVVRRQALLELLAKRPLSAKVIDGILLSARQLPGDMEKQETYHAIIDRDSLSEEQWNTLLSATGALAGDLQKSELLIAIAKKMPRSESLVLQYRFIARSLSSDVEYGRSLRAID